MCLWIHLENSHCQNMIHYNFSSKLWKNTKSKDCSFGPEICMSNPRDRRYYTLIAVIYSSVLWSVGLSEGRDEGGRGWMSKLFSQGEENVITVTFWWILQIRDKILEDINIIGHATLYQRTCGHPHHHPFWQEISEKENEDFNSYTLTTGVEMAVSSTIRKCPLGRERLVSDSYYNIIVLRLMGVLTGNYYLLSLPARAAKLPHFTKRITPPLSLN